MASYYLDTSALVKRYVQEVGTARVRELTNPKAGQDLYVVPLIAPEMVAAFFRKVLKGEVAEKEAFSAAARFKSEYRRRYQIVEISEALIDRAMTLAQQRGLRGYDAVHLAAASLLQDEARRVGLGPITFVCADIQLLNAAKAEGLDSENPT